MNTVPSVNNRSSLFTRLRCWICALGLLMPIGQTWSQPSTEVVLTVADQSSGVRDAALRTGLDKVIARLAGSRGVREFWIAPKAVLSSYQYRREYTPEGEELRLRLRFDPAALRRALQDQGFAVRGANSLPLMLWVANGADWLDAVEVGRQRPELLEQAAAWGWQLRFPQLDIAERSRVSADDLRSGFSRAWLDANQAYGLRWGLFVDLVQVESIWRTRWLLASSDRVVGSFEADGGDLAPLVEQAWAHFNNHIIEQQEYQRTTAPQQSWTVELLDLNAAGGYLRALKHLQTVAADYRIVAAEPGQLRLHLNWRGSADDWRAQTRQWGWRELAPPNRAMPVPDTTLSGPQAVVPVTESFFRFQVPAS